MEGCVREDRVKSGLIGKIFSGVLVDDEAAADAAGAGCGNHGRGGVDAGEDGSGGGECFRQCAVTAAEVEDALARLGIKEGDDG